jgi:hypothetical protein
VDNATNPALAISEDGHIGFAYQQLADRRGQQWWDTHFVLAKPGFSSPNPMVLAETQASVPLSDLMPYLGDYMDLVSVDNEFFGVFSANNDFINSVFPQGLTYARLGAGSWVIPYYGLYVEASIDPYFFAIERLSFAGLRKWLQAVVAKLTS